jgi:O-antigen ligase
MYQLSLNKVEWISISIIVAIISSITPPAVLGILTITAILLFLLNKYQKLILPLIILSYIGITSDYLKDFRIILNLLSTFLLIYLFLKKYGLQYSKYPRVPNGVISFVILLFFTLIFSTIFSSYPLTSIAATFRMFLFLIISYIFFALLENKNSILSYMYSIVAVMIIIGLPMLIDAYNLGLQKYFMRVILGEKLNLLATTRYSSFTIFFISMAIASSILFLKKGQSVSKVFLFILIIIFNISILILANSRGGIIAAILSVSFMLLILNRKLFFKGIFFISIIFLVLFFSITELNQAVTNYLRLDTVSDREVYWQMGFDIVKDNPISGVGVDVFDKFFFNYAPSSTVNYFKSDLLNIGKPHPHNFFLFYTAENGILGLLTSVMFFVMFFYYAFKTINLTKYKNHDFYIISVMATGIGIGLFFRSFIEITGYLVYGYITRDLPFWLIFVVLIFIYQKFSSKEDKNILNVYSVNYDRS